MLQILQPVKKILVPVDYSPTAAGAFQYALQLANDLGASIQLLNCVHPGMAAPEVPAMTADLTNRLLEISKENMAEFVSTGTTQLVQELDHLPVITETIELGSAVPVAKEVARREGADLIIMGTQGAEGFWGKLFGTVSADMLVNAPCPVLVIPEGSAYQTFNKICFATDLEGFDVFCGNQLVEMFGSLKPDLHLVHVVKNNRDEHPFDYQLIDLAYTRMKMEVQVEVEERKSDDIPSSIIAAAHDCGAEIIVMARPHYGLMDKLFHHSVTKDVAQQSDLPLLILPQDALEEQES